MFTGIIETTGTVSSIETQSDGIVLIGIESSISNELKVDQSVAHDGVCLTVVNINNNTHYLQVVPETLERSRLGDLQAGDRINLERAMMANSRLDGHFVQGHVDSTGLLETIDSDAYYTFSFPKEYSGLLVDKGSVCINGVSLTVTRLKQTTFAVALIPYTLEHTNLGDLITGSRVNLEFDILGKYVVRNIAQLNK